MLVPVIPGFHPDPSICRAGEEYFLINSSFEYFPGVPVRSSRNLIDWEHVGHVLDRTTQLDVRTGIDGASGGIFAPTIRFHEGRFWMVTTNRHDMRRGQLIVSSTHASGPWSDPVYTDGLIGIDPDLAWDEAGRCYLTWSDVQRNCISQARIDPRTGEVLSDARTIWAGTGGAHPEGPHIYSHAGWWYLMVAEGGTAAGHMITIARARSIEGPYAANPSNPILTHRSTTHAVQAVGHGDLFQLVDESWGMVCLGTRPRGSFPRWHTNGRETFLVGIEWVDNWPVVVEDQFMTHRPDGTFEDRFLEKELDPRWVSPGVDPASFAIPSRHGLALKPGRSADGSRTERLLGVRASDVHWNATVEAVGDVGLVVRIDDLHQAILQRMGDTVTARAIIGPADQTLAVRGDVRKSDALVIRSVPFEGDHLGRSGPDTLKLGLGEGDSFDELASFDGRYISTEVAGGFTGRMIGVEALGPDVVVERFAYTALRA